MQVWINTCTHTHAEPDCVTLTVLIKTAMFTLQEKCAD